MLLVFDFILYSDINHRSMQRHMLTEIHLHPIVRDFLYLRFIGDRTIDPKDFGRVQKDRVSELSIGKELKRVKEEEKVKVC